MARHKPGHRQRFGITGPPHARKPFREPRHEETAEHAGLVIANHGKALAVEDDGGRVWRCVARRRLHRAVSGDRVLWLPGEKGQGVITTVLPRRSLLARQDARGRERPVAANLDQILVVVATEPAFQEDLIDRYLVVAEHSGIHPVILLNKIDLLNPDELQAVSERLRIYGRLGYAVRLSSTKREGGLAALEAQLHDRASLLVGQSGVGKSSLVRHLLPETQVAVGAISDVTRLGRHTTTATTLYHLPKGGDIVDSPGVRDFGLWHIPQEEIARCFVELRPYLGRCRFRDCSHDREPDCALRVALEGGQIEPRRFTSYQAIMNSLR